MLLLLEEAGDAGTQASRAIGKLLQQPDGPERARVHRSAGSKVPATPEPPLDEDDVLIPVAGICRLQADHAMLCTTGYLAGPNDVTVPGRYVNRFGLRDGDVLEGAVRQPREGERRENFNALVRLDKVNGSEPEPGAGRPAFDRLVALAPSQRLRLETVPHTLVTRVIDIIAPLAKGHRVLVVAPAGRGKRNLIEQMVRSLSKSHGDCHLMLVALTDDLAAVTDYHRKEIRAEIIGSGSPPSAAGRIEVATLAIERAKRLVEMGHDVIVIIDSMTDLCKAYSDAAGNGRRLADADPPWIDEPRRLFFQARAVEGEAGAGGGSLTIVAAIDVHQSRTFDETLIVAPEELKIMRQLRRLLEPMALEAACKLLATQFEKMRSNAQFLLDIEKAVARAELRGYLPN